MTEFLAVAHFDIAANLRRRREMYKSKMLIVTLRFMCTCWLQDFNTDFL